MLATKLLFPAPLTLGSPLPPTEILELKTNRFLPSDKVSLGKYEKSIFEEPKVGLPGEQTEKKEPVRRYFPDKKLRNIALGKEKEPSMNEADDLYLYQIRADLRNAAFGDFQPNKEYFTEEEWEHIREQRKKILEEYKQRYEENKDLQRNETFNWTTCKRTKN